MMHGLSLMRRRYSLICIIFFIFLLYIILNLITPKYELFDNDRIRNLLISAEKSSFCSKRSARRGYNQHVLSVSAYESNDRIQLKTSVTWSYINTFVDEAKQFYPGWIVRVYHYNLINKTKDDIENFEKLHDNLDFCDVEHLPGLGNVRNKLPGKMQRFLPAIDPFVSVAVVRDLDSEIFEREVYAVDEWLSKTIYAFHTMRDHEQHGIPMLGGLWGIASNRLSIKDRLTIATALIPPEDETDRQRFFERYADTGDQRFLTDHIWPFARYNSLAHDSFTCFHSRYIYRGDTRPFPRQREHPSCFVGCPKPCCTPEAKNNKDFSGYKECPIMCRPTEHKDWLFC